ncbi:MAG: twitch domain-containing radical SAM protein [Elusimicrobiota bacterium]
MGARKEFLGDSKVFCILPWLHQYVATNGRIQSCCLAIEGVADLKTSTLSRAWNSPGMRGLRRNMLEGKPSPQCVNCYELEESRGRSLRQRFNDHWRRRLGEVEATRADGGLDEFRPPFISIRFSNVCNFRCRTCGPHDSTSWYEDARTLRGTVDHPRFLTPTEDPEELWRQLEPLVPTVEEIHFAGGEPLIMDEHYRLLRILIERRLFGVRLVYATNFSNMTHRGQDVLELWNKFESVEVSASLDGSGRRGEYLRKGQDWDQVVANRERLSRACPRVRFQVMPVLSAMNSLHLPDFHEDWLDKGYLGPGDWFMTMLHGPHEYRIQVLPGGLKGQVAEKFNRHAEHLLGRWGGAAKDAAAMYSTAVDFMMAQDRTDELERFRVTTRELDRLRGESFAAVFPELAELMLPDPKSAAGPDRAI